jgi:hypothetical protein
MISNYPRTGVIRDLDSNNTANVNAANRLDVSGIDYAHAEVHQGKFYTVSYIANGVASASSLEFFFITGANFELHTAILAAAGSDAELYIFEATTVSDNGTALTAYNNLRSSVNTAEGDFYHTPTITGDGTQISVVYIPSSGTQGGGAVRPGTEVIFKVSTNYLIRLTNTGTGAQDLSLAIGFYEDT